MVWTDDNRVEMYDGVSSFGRAALMPALLLLITTKRLINVLLYQKETRTSKD